MDNNDVPPPIRSIVVGNHPRKQHQQQGLQQGVVVDTTFHRAVHKIRLSALSHNYSEVESAANRQRCSVIVVVKADGYGHGAIPSAIFLADKIGADAFAVATLEEGIALRKALQETAATTQGSDEHLNHYFNLKQNLTVANDPRRNAAAAATLEQDSMSLVTNSAFTAMYGSGSGIPNHSKRKRASHIRILVLGPPVGFPRCFDDYYHYNIEAMISGPEVAMALYEWVSNTDERKRLQVERAANELKERILSEPKATKSLNATNPTTTTNNNANATKPTVESSATTLSTKIGDNGSVTSSSGRDSSRSSGSAGMIQAQIPSATLTNVTGSDLAKEVREILKNQKLAAETQKQQQQQLVTNQQRGGGQTPDSNSITPVMSTMNLNPTSTGGLASVFSPGPNNGENNINTTSTTNADTSSGTVQVFAGLEEIARHSRTRQKAMASEVFHDRGGDDDDDDEGDHIVVDENDDATRTHQKQNHDRENGGDARSNPIRNKPPMIPAAPPTKKRLRWHALVDSGMGRLGFRADPVSNDDKGQRRDTVEILKELFDLEVVPDCPIEFYGMCTHMADASNSTSTFTDDQMNKFKALLKRVRAAQISVPTISTDNSAALLTTNLRHFTANAKELLTQNDADTRGFVRTGGAIYGQRPSFTQLRAVSTLMASVRHVAILKEGETVGYDRAYVAPMNVRIATLTIGFADGYPRELGNGVGSVSIRGHLFPVAGNVCMDMLMVELGPAGDKDGIGAKVVVGDTALLWGPDDGEEGEGHVRLKDLAAVLKTTQSALTCGLNKERVLRQYA